jgi:hypothetical protein
MKIRGGLGSVYVTAAILTPWAVSAQTSLTWDGVWKGYWDNKRYAVLEIVGGKIASYTTGGASPRITSVENDGQTLTFFYPTGHVKLTRTGANSANGFVIAEFNGRRREIGQSGGVGSASASGSFVRQQ